MDRHVYKSVTEANRESVLCLHVCLPDFSSYIHTYTMRERNEKQRERERVNVRCPMDDCRFLWSKKLETAAPIARYPSHPHSILFIFFSLFLYSSSLYFFLLFLILKKTKITLYYCTYGTL